MFPRFATLLVALAPLAAACSSSGGGVGTTDPGTLTAFAGYCTGTLSVDKALLGAAGAGAWASDGTHAGAGTSFLLANDFSTWRGFVIRTDGTPAEIDGDFAKGLGMGTDFTSSCAGDGSKTREVVLGKATLYSNKDLTGTACALDSGTELAQMEFIGGDVASISATVVKTQCGLDIAYSKDLHYGALVLK